MCRRAGRVLRGSGCSTTTPARPPPRTAATPPSVRRASPAILAAIPSRCARPERSDARRFAQRHTKAPRRCLRARWGGRGGRAYLSAAWASRHVTAARAGRQASRGVRHCISVDGEGRTLLRRWQTWVNKIVVAAVFMPERRSLPRPACRGRGEVGHQRRRYPVRLVPIAARWACTAGRRQFNHSVRLANGRRRSLGAAVRGVGEYPANSSTQCRKSNPRRPPGHICGPGTSAHVSSSGPVPLSMTASPVPTTAQPSALLARLPRHGNDDEPASWTCKLRETTARMTRIIDESGKAFHHVVRRPTACHRALYTYAPSDITHASGTQEKQAPRHADSPPGNLSSVAKLRTHFHALNPAQGSPPPPPLPCVCPCP